MGEIITIPKERFERNANKKNIPGRMRFESSGIAKDQLITAKRICTQRGYSEISLVKDGIVVACIHSLSIIDDELIKLNDILKEMRSPKVIRELGGLSLIHENDNPIKSSRLPPPELHLAGD